MKAKLSFSFLFLLAISIAPRASAQSTAFSYQGRLSDGTGAATGSYDLQFVLFDAVSDGNALAGTNTLTAVAVSNGLFTVRLDFGSTAFDGAARWLQIAVRTNGSGGASTTLAPRQPMTPVPYAIRAGNASLLNGQGPSAFAPATGSAQYVGKSGDTMTGTLNLPANGLRVGSKHLVLSDDLVGIGTQTPTEALTIGDGSSATLRKAILINSGWSEPGPPGTPVPGDRLMFYEAGASWKTGIGFGELNDIWFQAGVNIGHRAFRFFTGEDAGATPTEKLTIMGNGNVGIGTTAPSTSLEVVGNHASAPVAVFRQSNPANLGSVAIDSPADNGSRPSHLLFRRAGVDRWSLGGFYPSDFFGIGTSQLLADQKLVVDTDGNVGIGTTSPQAKLHVEGGSSEILLRRGDGSNAAYISGNPALNGGNGRIILYKANNDDGVYLNSEGSSYFRGGRVGIGTRDPEQWLDVRGIAVISGGVGIGTTTPSRILHTVGDAVLFERAGQQITVNPNYGVANTHAAIDGPSGKQLRLSIGDSDKLTVDSGGNVGIGTTSPTAKLEVNGSLKVTGADNSVTTPVLTITGGADVAEPFQMSVSDIPKGSVVVIDEENAGRLKLSEQAYDSRVAGIVSGAGGVQPGITLSQQGVLEGGQNVALSGRVYVQADATEFPIKPGDLLTTSATAGHAMKVREHARAQGAILGKAMSGLKEGKGLVLVLVTLQ